MKITKTQIFATMLLMGAVVILAASWLLREPIRYMINSAKWNPENVQKTIDSGNEIISALSAFQKDTGAFPDSLDALVPKYLEKIPAPSVPDYVWEYERFKSDGEYKRYEESDEEYENGVDTFHLSVSYGEYRYPAAGYNSNYKCWHIDQ